MEQEQAITSAKTPSRITKVLREILAFILWSYFILKIFVFDFDVYFIETYLPSWAWAVRYKFLIFLSIIAITLLVFGIKNFSKTLAFVLIYPFFFLFWRILKLFFRNWVVGFGIISILIPLIKSLKINLTIFCMTSITIVVILTSANKLLLLICSLILLLYLIIHYSKKLYLSFMPSRSLLLIKDVAVSFADFTKEQFKLPVELRETALHKYSKEQKTKWITNLQFLVLINKAISYIAIRLRELQERRIVFLYFLFGLLLTLFLTVSIFALVNYALQKTDPSSFELSVSANFFSFIYYSFNTILTNNITDFYPVTTLSRFLNSLEILFGFLILVIMVFVYTNVKSDRTKKELDMMISSLEEQEQALELYVNSEFSVDIEQAIVELEKAPGNMVKVIYFFSTKK